MTTIDGERWTPVVTAVLSALTLAMAGALLTDLGPWYYALAYPAWKPPDWLFGPAWTLIFSLSALAGLRAWRQAPTRPVAWTMVGLFAANGLLNMLWSLLFFRLQRPDWAVVEVVFLWLSIVALIVVMRPYAPTSSVLLGPYLAWVSFAAALNFAIVDLNAPF